MIKDFIRLEPAAGRRSGTVAGLGDRARGLAGSYGNSLLAPHYVRLVADEAGLELIALSEGVIDHRQDLYVLRRC